MWSNIYRCPIIWKINVWIVSFNRTLKMAAPGQDGVCSPWRGCLTAGLLLVVGRFCIPTLWSLWMLHQTCRASMTGRAWHWIKRRDHCNMLCGVVYQGHLFVRSVYVCETGCQPFWMEMRRWGDGWISGRYAHWKLLSCFSLNPAWLFIQSLQSSTTLATTPPSACSRLTPPPWRCFTYDKYKKHYSSAWLSNHGI